VTKLLAFDAMFSLANEMEILQRLTRTGYTMSGVSEPQSVGSHTFGVALWCLLLLERMEDTDSLDTQKILRMAVIHEVGEARISDIPMPARKYLGDEAVSQAEGRAVQDMLKEFPEDWFATWQEFEDCETREARIVKAADKLELMHKILCYEHSHNGNFEKFWVNDNNFRWAGIDEAKEIFEEMKRRHSV
jgi:putative hydrolase of HD superfamily